MGPQQARLSVLACSHPACLTHDPGPAHPEHPERLRAVVEALRSAFGERLTWVEAPRATREQLLRAHTGRLVDELERALPASRIHRLDADTSMSPGSL